MTSPISPAIKRPSQKQPLIQTKATRKVPHFGMYGPNSTVEEANSVSHVQALLGTSHAIKVATDIIPKTSNPAVVTMIAQRIKRTYGNIDHPIFHANQSTILHSVTYRGNAELVQTLINLGADPNVPDREGRTAFDRIEQLSAGSKKATQKLQQQIRHILQNPPPKPVQKPLFQWPSNPLPSLSSITGLLSTTASTLYGLLPSLPTMPSFSLWRSAPSSQMAESESESDIPQNTSASSQISNTQHAEKQEQSTSLRQASQPAEVQQPHFEQVMQPLEPSTHDRGVQVEDVEKQKMAHEISKIRLKKDKLQQRLTEIEQQQQTQQIDFSTQKSQLIQENRRLRQDLKKVTTTAEQAKRQLESEIASATEENQSLRQELQQKTKTTSSRIHVLEEQHKELHSQLDQARETEQRLQKEAEEFRKQAEKANLQLQAEQLETRRKHSAQKKQQKQLQKLEQENQQLLKTLQEAQASQAQSREQLTQQLDSIQQENLKLQAELTEAHKLRAETAEKAHTAEQATQRLQTELNRTRTQHRQSQSRLHRENRQLNQQISELQETFDQVNGQNMQSQQWYAWQLGNSQMENQALYQANADFANTNSWLWSGWTGAHQYAQTLQEHNETLQAELEEARQPQRHPAMTEHIGRLMTETSDLRVRNYRLHQDLYEIRQHLQQGFGPDEAQEQHMARVHNLLNKERAKSGIKRSQSFSL